MNEELVRVAGRPVTVLVADDQKIIREGVATILRLLDGVEVVGTAGDGTEAVGQAERLDPDVVLMDLQMPGVDGVAATAELRRRGMRAAVVVLTTFADDDWVFRALRAGARGFVTKDASADEIQHAIVTVARGEAQLDPSVQRRLVDALLTGQPVAVASGVGPADDLTPRESEVLREIAHGSSNAEIATQLWVSTATVKTHVNHLLAKTGCRDRAALVAYAYRTGRGG